MGENGSTSIALAFRPQLHSPLSPFATTSFQRRECSSGTTEDELSYAAESMTSGALRHLFEAPNKRDREVEVLATVDDFRSAGTLEPLQQVDQTSAGQGAQVSMPENGTPLRRMPRRGSLAAIQRPRSPGALRSTPPGSPSGMAVHSRRNSLARSDTYTAPSRESITVENAGTYLIGNVIGRGQFGTVHRAINTSTGSIVAIKRIPIDDKSREQITAIMHEVNLLSALSSPTIVKYEGCLTSDTCISIIIEYVENGSLLHTLRTFGPFGETLCALYTTRILDGLVYLHSKDVVHCDIKCANVLSTKTGDVKLSDFGISLNLSGQSTIRGEVNGTPNWLAPEVISLRGISKASDIWSLGCTVLEMITGRPPYSGQNAMSTMYSIVEDQSPPLPDNISGELSDFLLACFCKEPRDRPSASALRDHDWLDIHRQARNEISPTRSILSSGSETAPIEVITPTCLAAAGAVHRVDEEALTSTIDTKTPKHTTAPEQVSSSRPQERPKAIHSTTRQNSRPRAVINVHNLKHTKSQYEIVCVLCKELIKKGASCGRCRNCQQIAHSSCFINIPVICRSRAVFAALAAERDSLHPAQPRVSSPAPSDMYPLLRKSKPMSSHNPISQKNKCHPIILRKKNSERVLVSSADCLVM